ncbi:MAG: hypothetical protein WCW87_02215 [Candidatus Paceibacterota bacterium]
MADKKSKDKKEESVEGLPVLLEVLLFALIIVAVIRTVVMFVPGVSEYFYNGEQPKDAVGRIFYSGVATSKPVLNIGDNVKDEIVTKVYDVPNGEVVGVQSKDSKGTVVSSEEDGYVRVDYEQGADGWVLSDNLISSKIYFAISSFFENTFSFLKTAGIVFATFFILGIIYLLYKILGKDIKPKTKENTKIEKLPKKVEVKNEKWEKIQQDLESTNPADWRLSILEADILLAELLENIGCFGETIGEKLKSVDKNEFTNIDAAWEAHKIRNQIAHQGVDFLMTKRETDRVIALYKKVFDEFHFI